MAYIVAQWSMATVCSNSQRVSKKKWVVPKFAPKFLPPLLEKPQDLDEKLQENLISTAIGCPLKHLKAS